MTGLIPGLLDRLVGGATTAGGQRCTIEQLKDSIARDLEALLNTRLAVPTHLFDEYPLARASVLDYGVPDFAAMCLSSAEDREAICASIKRAIEAHETRLVDVNAAIGLEPGSVNRLTFVITARLATGPAGDTVNFNAVLQPSTLHYAINRGQRPRRPGGAATGSD